MQQPMQPIIQHLFQVSSLEEVSRQRLEAFVEEYPSFGIGHYLLSRKLKAEGSERYPVVTQKTNLYFTNPFWLQWQLDNVSLAGGRVERLTAAEPAVLPEQVTAFDGPAEAVEMPVAPVEEVVTVAAERHELPAGDDLAEALSAGKVDGLTLDEARNMTAGEGEFFEGEPVPVAGGTEQHQEPSAAELLLRSIEEARELRESLFRINTDFAAETAVAGETPPVEAEAPIRDEESPFVLEEAAEPVMETESPVQPVEEMQPEVVQPVEVQPAVAQEPVEQQVAEARPEPVGDAAVLQPEPVTQPVAEPSFVFEPYHTIDYFASQGIKLTLDENPSDPLGKQLKSFTDWLKSMRRLPQKDREVIPDRVLEQTVQNFAAHSIEGKEVVTETMAEVLAKQGMREKARVVYEKLSLLNPDKRAYFATKIEQLNIL